MTYKEREQLYCIECNLYMKCGWSKVSRYANCIGGQDFMHGWEKGREETLDEIEEIYKNEGAIGMIEYFKGIRNE